ncbi:MAG: DUF2344 domain-containing protein [Anaerolineales bacterium]|nr:MAG: DUF2344 domain-containing protein [Anaerolineales bacterium]
MPCLWHIEKLPRFSNSDVEMPGVAMNIENNPSSIPDEKPMQTPSLRHRITFATERTLAYVSVLELTAIWERSLRRGAIPLRYSQGFNPRPKMNFAAPLPVGCGSEAELLDIWLEESLYPEAILSAMKKKTPVDLHIVDISAINIDAPTLSEQLRSAEYSVWLQDITVETLKTKIEALLAMDVIQRPRRGKKYRGKIYDLRKLIMDLRVTSEGNDPLHEVWMHLMAEYGATGRPDEVIQALGIAHCLRRCSRSRLILTDTV